MTKVLLIDDDYSDYLFVKDCLEDSLNLKLEYKESYEEALNYLRELSFDVDFLVIDYDLGAMKGNQLYQEVKKYKEVPAVFLTGNLDPAVEEKLKELACLAVFNKDNYDMQDLIGLISSKLTLERIDIADIKNSY